MAVTVPGTLTRGIGRWTFSAPSALLPGTLHTISADGSLHVAETVEVEMTETTGTVAAAAADSPCCMADGAVAAYRYQDAAIKIREYDGELYVVATHRGKMFQSIKSLYNSIDDSEQVPEPVSPYDALTMCCGLPVHKTEENDP